MLYSVNAQPAAKETCGYKTPKSWCRKHQSKLVALENIHQLSVMIQ